MKLKSIVSVVGTELLGPIEADTVAALEIGLLSEARFVECAQPVEIIRSALRSSIFGAENDPRAQVMKNQNGCRNE